VGWLSCSGLGSRGASADLNGPTSEDFFSLNLFIFGAWSSFMNHDADDTILMPTIAQESFRKGTHTGCTYLQPRKYIQDNTFRRFPCTFVKTEQEKKIVQKLTRRLSVEAVKKIVS
jgi:hypothetical protein